MKSRILNLCAGLSLFCGGATAQTLSVTPIHADEGAQTEIAVSVAGATEMTALQFNLALPDGLDFKQTEENYGVTLGEAAANHAVCVSALDPRKVLVVVYSMSLTTFTDGALLTIPVVAKAEEGTTQGDVSNMRTATCEAISTACDGTNFSTSVRSTTLSIEPLKTEAEAEAEIAVNITGATAKTALQFTLGLPKGLKLKQTEGDFGVTLGDASPNHTLSVSELQTGEYLFVLYDMNLNTFGDGTLLTIPVIASTEAGETSGLCTDVRTATMVAKSYQNADVNFSATVEGGATGIEGVENETMAEKSCYDLQGRKVGVPTRGVYILNGKKVMVK